MRILLLCLCLMLGQAALAQNRHALVIGIDGYENITPLLKAVNDGRAVGGLLEERGFAVTLAVTPAETTHEALIVTMAAFAARVMPGDTVVVFFAGHGVEIDGQNYLIPVDLARPDAQGIGAEDLVAARSFAASDILNRLLSRRPGSIIMILDACRDNPFAGDGGRSIGLVRGLGRMIEQTGVFMLYSAGIGEAALDRLSDDDPDPNSVFTRVLLPLLAEDGLHPGEIARRARVEVERIAATVNRRQSPAYYDGVAGDFVLFPAAAPVAGDSAEGPVPDGPAVPDPALPDPAVPDPAVPDPAKGPAPAVPDPVTPGAPPQTLPVDGCGMAVVRDCLAILTDPGADGHASPESAVSAVLAAPIHREILFAIFQTASGSMGAQVTAALQRQLQQDGSYGGEVDGQFGPQTLSALQAWRGGPPGFARPDITLNQRQVVLVRDRLAGCYLPLYNPVPDQYAEWSGACDADGFVAGYGQLTFVYPGPVPQHLVRRAEGLFGRGILQGPASVELVSGVRETGSFVQGVRNGYGETVWPDGTLYQGNYVMGTAQGRGQLVLRDGRTFVGVFYFGGPTDDGHWSD